MTARRNDQSRSIRRKQYRLTAPIGEVMPQGLLSVARHIQAGKGHPRSRAVDARGLGQKTSFWLIGSQSLSRRQAITSERARVVVRGH